MAYTEDEKSGKKPLCITLETEDGPFKFSLDKEVADELLDILLNWFENEEDGWRTYLSRTPIRSR